MASLKDLKNRIQTVKSSQKITKAMKMVAASKLRRAKDAIENSRKYMDKLTQLLRDVGKKIESYQKFPIVFGRENPKKVLILSVSSNRGLCGAFNNNIYKATLGLYNQLKSENKEIEILSIGKKALELLNSKHKNFRTILFQSEHNDLIEDMIHISKDLQTRFYNQEIDECYIVYNKFISAVSQQVADLKLIPLNIEEQDAENTDSVEERKICEPNAEDMAEELISEVLKVNLLRAVLESSASEHGARMTAMENASKNASEMIKKLTVKYNRTRQSAITTELVEIIAGAEAINDG